MIRNNNGITNEIINNVYKFYTTAIFSEWDMKIFLRRNNKLDIILWLEKV